jgi:hypothetical protein
MPPLPREKTVDPADQSFVFAVNNHVPPYILPKTSFFGLIDRSL